MSKVLYFKGMGWEGADSSQETDLLNCRIRTSFKNRDGRLIFLEASGWKRNKYTPKDITLNIIGHINHCFYLDIDWDKRNNYSRELHKLEMSRFEYNKESLLKIINEKLNCDFDDIVTVNDINSDVYDDGKVLGDCSIKGVKPFIDEPILMDVLDGIKPTFGNIDSYVLNYSIDWEDIKDFDFIKDNMREDTNKNNFTVVVRQLKGEVNSMELFNGSRFPVINLSKEIARELIHYLK